jgi:ATP-dependent DNA helicase RecQ
MNFLQIAAGTGEGQSYEFDIAAFSTAFKINILTATYAIKTLEQEEILRFNEVFFKPSSLVFTTDREQLEDFEKRFPQLEPIVKGLLRSYEGIFNSPATIYESELGKFLRKNIPDIKKELMILKQHGLVDYSAQKDTPQLTLLLNRMYADSFVINLDNYLQRKKNFETRIKSMKEYITNLTSCRSQTIARYFNDPGVKACGICDNCINQKALVISKEEFEQITQHITNSVHQKNMDINELLIKSKQFKKEKLWKVIDYLQAEKKLSFSNEGNISVTDIP